MNGKESIFQIINITSKVILFKQLFVKSLTSLSETNRPFVKFKLFYIILWSQIYLIIFFQKDFRIRF